MSILVFVEGAEGEVKKSSLEAVSYAAELAKKKGVAANAVAIGSFTPAALESLGNYGAAKVLHISNDKLNQVNVMAYATALTEAANKENAEVVVLPKSSAVDAIVSRLATKLKAGVVTGAIELPDTSAGFKVKKSIY